MPVRKKELKLANKKNKRAEKNKRVAIKQGERTRRKAIKQGERTERDASYQKSERTKSRQNTKRTKSSNKTSTKKAIIAGLLERYKKKKAGKTSDTAKSRPKKKMDKAVKDYPRPTIPDLTPLKEKWLEPQVRPSLLAPVLRTPIRQPIKVEKMPLKKPIEYQKERKAKRPKTKGR